MELREFTVGEHTFAVGALEPKRAFHIARRIAPVLGSLKDLVPLVTGAGFKSDDAGDLAMVVQPIAEALAKMPEEDANYILDNCLAVARLRIGEGRGWSPISVGGRLSYDWITMPMMVRIVWEAIQHNLANFLPAGAPAS